MQHRQAVWQAKHPGGRGGKPIGEVVAMVKKLVGSVDAVAPLAAHKLTVVRGLGNQPIELFGQATLFGQEFHLALGVGHTLGGLRQQRVQLGHVYHVRAVARLAQAVPLLAHALQADLLELFGRSKA